MTCASVMTCARASSSGILISSQSPSGLRTNARFLSLIMRSVICIVALSTVKLSGVTVPCTTYSPRPQEPSMMIDLSSPFMILTENITPAALEYTII